MIRKTPFHDRTSAANETGLWSHWAGYLAPDRYQMSDKFEYFAVRNSAGVFDTSPLYKYWIHGRDAERYLSGVLIRDIRRCPPGRAQYTAWCDDDGWVMEDGVIFRHSEEEFLLTSARSNLSYFDGLIGGRSVQVEDVSEQYGALALQGPYARQVLGQLAAGTDDLRYFHLAATRIGETAVTISRTGYTGDLGYEIWVSAEDAVDVWDSVFEAAAPFGVIPVGQDAILIARIEAGLLLVDVDYHSARYAWNDDQRSSPLELNLGWMLRSLESDDRVFIGRRSIEREVKEGTSRWKTVGVAVDWQEWARAHNERGIITPKDHTPVHGVMMLYDENLEQIGYVSSFVYSPLLQRHIGIARVHPDHAETGTKVDLEVTIDHRYEVVASRVTRLPFYDPSRKKA